MVNVFISHRSADNELATRLAHELESAEHLIWLDEWEIEFGDSIVEKMNQGLTGATVVILCCSSEGVESNWMSREWMSALARQLNGEQVRLIPALLSGERVPAILADIKYVNLIADWEKGVEDILSVLS